MAGKTKIQNEQEAIRWIEEGRTYQWIVEEYERKYNITTTPTMWSNFRRRKGIEGRIVRDDDLIPWEVRKEHRWSYPVMMLRAEARRRAGRELRGTDAKRLASWLQTLDDLNAVVLYNPNTDDGFFLVPREKTDDDIIRRPKRKTTTRRAAE